MTVIAGVDLAWSGRNPTGVCVLDARDGPIRLIDLGCTESTADAVAIFKMLNELGPDVVAGIDAPLLVGPARRAEAELARAFGRQGVYAYSARMAFLERHGIAEGPCLGGMLAAAGWNLNPGLITARGLHAIEVFPHATIVSLLGAESALKYKKGSLARRAGPLREFQALLRAHCKREVPELLGTRVEPLLSPASEPGSSSLSTRETKVVEDQLDALACALAALHAVRHGPEALLVFGDETNGYIAVPKPVTSSPVQSSP